MSTTDYTNFSSKMTADPVLEMSDSEDYGATTSNNFKSNQHFISDVVSPSSPRSNGWVFHSPPSTISLQSPSLVGGCRTTFDLSSNDAALKEDESTTPTSQYKDGSGLGFMSHHHDALAAHLRSSPTFSESHESFLSQSSDNPNDSGADQNGCGLPSICSSALTPSDITTDHLLDFVMRLTDTPPDRHLLHRYQQNNVSASNDPYHQSLLFDGGARPRCMTEDPNHLHHCSAAPITTSLLADLPFASTVHRNTQFEHSLFSRSTTTTSEGHEGPSTMNLYNANSSSANSPLCCSSFSSSTLDANTCRSSLSLVSNNGSLTTAASTPSGTPTWSQDLTTPSEITSRASPSLLQHQSGQDSLLMGSRLLCSPLSGGSDTPKGSLEELLSDDDLAEQLSASQRSLTSTTNYFPSSNLLRLVDDVHHHDVHLPSLRPMSKSSSSGGSGSGTSSSNRNCVDATFQASPQCKSSATGLRHLHSGATTATNGFIQTAAGGSHGGEDDGYGRQQQSGSSSSSHAYRGFDGNWNEDKQHRDQRRNNNNNQNNGGGISKGLTDFYSLAYASKRWQNLNIVLPLYIPHGTIAVVRSTGENTYVFPDQYPPSQLLFSGSGKICDMWATYLRLRVAVVHKCPEFLVPRVAQVFNHVLTNLPKFSEPIHLRCAGVVKHTIQLRSSGGLTYRYDTIGQISNAPDQEKMRVLFDALQKVMSEVNHYLAREVEDVFKSLQGVRGVDLGEEHDSIIRGGQGGSSSSSNSKCGLEFRFSPCKELKIAIREGTVCDCNGVDSVIAGGGASSMSAWAQQFVVEDLIVGELRMERDKTSETQLDPFFLPHAEVKTRMISKDLDGNPARISFVDESVYPDYYRPRVEYAVGLTPLQAAEQLVGATHQPLAKLLPNGMNSLTSQPTGNALHIPGVSLPHMYNAAGGSSSSVPVTPFAERTSMTGTHLGRHPFGPAISKYALSPTPSGPFDPSAWSGFPSDQRPDPFSSYPRQQQQQLGWNIPQQQRGGVESSRETPVTGDAASDALKGLAVLQKMLSNLNLSNNNQGGAEGAKSAASGMAENQSPREQQLPSISPSSAGKADAQQLGTVIGQAAAAAMALGRHPETISRTPEAAALLSQLQSALQKIPYINANGAATHSHQNVIGTPDSTSSPMFASTSPKPDVSIQHQPHAHLPFPSVDGTTTNHQRLFDIESMEDVEASQQSTRSINDSNGDATTQHLMDEHELGLFRGSKSVGATPVNYSTSAGGVGLGSSPTTTISSSSFIHAGNSTTHLYSQDHLSASPTPCTTAEGSSAVVNKNGFNGSGGVEDVDNRKSASFGITREQS